ncbi:MAG: ABC transporter permease [Gallionellales bacterium 35-53-114]|jgi:putative ABC transport system permease protein|nr:MAG: ABC transporter permease [Gallionellales bacterium 35-53-114]OYZ62974.1 MAG: ABC transporter permease [Gallionellales bacterium 24-53-125]OZB09044.1 MAG: ABC transporter permease [Gallionellales bacterium 39-52-133]HQS59270.1 FtsX-like permease family protein [Gallionellaceae bacterium]HQS76183.1 FtsX-like permease family protein [Gallionellaceae bacterium]
MNNIKLAISMLARDWRAGEWRVLLIALVLAVGSISTVGLFSDRVRQALQQEAHSLLGADLRINSIRSVPPAYRSEAQNRGLRVVSTATFPSMVTHDSDSLLGEIQALEDGYPLRGKIEITAADDNATLSNFDKPVQGHIAQTVPARGTVWADERLMRRMDVQLGDELILGSLRLRLAARVIKDVDQSVSFASVAPRVHLNMADLAATGLVQVGSRINYRLLVAGDSEKVLRYRDWVAERIKPGEKIEDVRDARPEIRQAMERAEHFLGLAALMAFVLAGIAMALAARQFITRHLDSCAVMRCLGATQNQVLRIFLFQFLMLGVAAVLLGGLIGWSAQASLVQAVEALREASLPAPGWLPLVQAAISGFALLLGFTFLPLWQLKSVTPLRVIRRELGVPSANTGLMYASGAVVLGLLFLWQAGSIKLGLTVLAGLAAGLLLFGLIAWSSLRLLAALPIGKRHVFANLARHGRSNAVQIVALSLGGMSLLLLTLVRTELMQNWRERLPPEAPNRFIVNVQQDQREPVQQFFKQQELAPPSLFPMVRGRLIAINERSIKSDDFADSRARGLVERETNLSWSADVPEGNQMVLGRWWPSAIKPGDEHAREISLEEGLARTLGIFVGDMLTYDIAGSEYTAKVVNLRKVRWDSMQVNFFVITTPGQLENYPTSYLSSFYLPPDKVRAGDALLKAFPNLLVIDTEAIITQMRHIMDQIAQTLGAVFLFTLLSGLAVLYAALLATQDERIYQSAILRTLGADTHYLRRQHLSEFAVLGALSGLFAAAGSAALGWVLAKFVLEIPFAPPALLWLTGISGGMLIVMLSGWLVTRKVVKLPPLQVLAA